MIKYSKKSLFSDETNGRILVHACNAQGVWGAGIAKEFKNKYHNDYVEYIKNCRHSLGFAILTKNKIGCLITSYSFGKDVDKPGSIIVNTVGALRDLIRQAPVGSKFASNKFNSGMFNVPWETTEAILNHFVEAHGLDWTVYTNEEV